MRANNPRLKKLKHRGNLVIVRCKKRVEVYWTNVMGQKIRRKQIKLLRLMETRSKVVKTAKTEIVRRLRNRLSLKLRSQVQRQIRSLLMTQRFNLRKHLNQR
jgi:hypothetical protein